MAISRRRRGLGCGFSVSPWEFGDGPPERLTSLVILRFLTGIGLGGAMPNSIAMTAEYGPKRSQATMVMVMFCGFPIGASL